jgi:hypothetical protein
VAVAIRLYCRDPSIPSNSNPVLRRLPWDKMLANTIGPPKLPLALLLCLGGGLRPCLAGGQRSRRSATLTNGPPLVINTWPFTSATEVGWAALQEGGEDARLNAVERGCSECEAAQCDGSVGYGSVPDSVGEVTLDALIMDGPTHDAGSVACLRGVREAISVARAVMMHTSHTLLVGEKASDFARMMGFEEWRGRSETTNSVQSYLAWLENSCQPNYYRGFEGGNSSCPPYPAPDYPVQGSKGASGRCCCRYMPTLSMMTYDVAIPVWMMS